MSRQFPEVIRCRATPQMKRAIEKIAEKQGERPGTALRGILENALSRKKDSDSQRHIEDDFNVFLMNLLTEHLDYCHDESGPPVAHSELQELVIEMIGRQQGLINSQSKLIEELNADLSSYANVASTILVKEKSDVSPGELQEGWKKRCEVHTRTSMRNDRLAEACLETIQTIGAYQRQGFWARLFGKKPVVTQLKKAEVLVIQADVGLPYELVNWILDNVEDQEKDDVPF